LSETDLLPLAQTIHQDLAGLSDLFRRRLLNDRENREATAALHEQLGWMRESLAGATLRPLLYDLVLMADRVENAGEDDTGLAASLRLEILDVLARYGVHRMPDERGRFDPGEQEAVGTVETDDESRRGTVAMVVRHGYRMGEQLLRPQRVRVYVCGR
jgi:molecular chaperone GrpE